MSDRRKPQISQRKQPQQTRSTELVSYILEAAVQVLKEEGAVRFTSARVAEAAGVSVGSLYQYFPNKAAILFRLQSDEWQATLNLIRGILEDGSRSPSERLRTLVQEFVRSECDEATMRIALNDAAPLYRDAPEAQEAKVEATRAIRSFMREALPHATEEKRAETGDLITMTLSTTGKQFSESPRNTDEIKAFADSMADMFCAYIESLNRES